jgi:hypothetical protein
MSIKIKQNPLTEAIKPKDDQSNYKPDQVFAKDHFLYLLVGRKRSGKSTLALNLLDTPEKIGGFKKKFDKIWLVSPTAQYDSKMHELVEELEPEGQYYDTFNNEVQHELMQKIKQFNTGWKNKKRKPHHLVIYDDVLAFLPSNKKKGQFFNSFMTNQRHFKCSCIIMSQRLNELNPLIRSQADIISYFRQDNPKEDKIFSETFGVDDKLIKTCTMEPHSFITANFLHDIPKFYKRFDEINFGFNSN